ncbi:hypothetical protein SAMN05444920_105263 [Nonomuraea solani]|uniref:Uncharacterized protein n=1 Tax=Nonomuraea solani TaxID=1144553 RepID=A0A1H6DGC3_9ACTN|nr:hypothetical protein SAMN05444920_105263 [Nonomuraea solani]
MESGASPKSGAPAPKTGPSSAPSRPQAAGAAGKAPASGSKSETPGDDEPGGAKAGAGGKGGRQGTVKVIVGTRRYHSTACPLIRGAGDSGVETMTLAAAEAAGLTSCSVCQHDRETVG